MTEATLQILLLLAYLAIGLISVTFPIYALCVTYLKQEQAEYKQERKKRIAKLKQIIDDLNKQLSGEPIDSGRFKKIQAEIKDYRAERWRARLLYLTSTGAVLLPITLLLVALALACAGIYFFYEGNELWVFQLIVGSCVFIGSAVLALYRTILAVEYAALRPARTIEFEVCYATREKTAKVKVDKESKLSIGVGPKEEDVENAIIGIMIPPEITVAGSPEDAFLTLQPEWHTFRGFMLMSVRRPLLFKDIFSGIPFTVVSYKVGTHRIFVEVRAKGVHPYNDELTLEVVE